FHNELYLTSYQRKSRTNTPCRSSDGCSQNSGAWVTGFHGKSCSVTSTRYIQNGFAGQYNVSFCRPFPARLPFQGGIRIERDHAAVLKLDFLRFSISRMVDGSLRRRGIYQAIPRE